jgi:hypothetical protein
MVKALEAEGFTPPQKSVLFAVANHANEDGESIFPSVERLTIYTALSERTVRAVLGQLRDLKVIVVTREATHNRPTEYALDYDKLPRSKKLPPPGARRGAALAPLPPPGVQPPQVRGAALAPESSVNRQLPSPSLVRTAPMLTGHPAIEAYHAAAGKWPPDFARQTIITTVGSDPVKIELWSKVCQAAVLRGWRPENLSAMLDHFQAGTIPTGGKDHDAAATNTRRTRTSRLAGGAEVGRRIAPAGILTPSKDGPRAAG